MMGFILLLISTMSFAVTRPLHWSYIVEAKEKHEFYKDFEEIKKPSHSWQALFALVYVDRDLKKIKDCVYYYVPGTDPGKLKIKTLPADTKCEDKLFEPGDLEINDIRKLHFSVSPKEVILDFAVKDASSTRWTAQLQDQYVRPEPALNISSAEFKSPKMILIAPKSVPTPVANQLKDKVLCHNINEDCAEVSPSTCAQCENGWYEVPNGCEKGPKYCGNVNCGGKGEPACRRGLKWQRAESEFDCRTDSSFAYCSRGAAIVCEGRKAFCR